ncbi:hypothetical protein A3Q56_02073 [Intoshia linei]|uniref:enoyl-CoA hydratase n=1 Tax=Intoshia linei TaxID=1819745 RepID=A0A177B7A3_9BILA|nr:hypothetical protein A3Q56_02073 [Intoshia linei]
MFNLIRRASCSKYQVVKLSNWQKLGFRFNSNKLFSTNIEPKYSITNRIAVVNLNTRNNKVNVINKAMINHFDQIIDEITNDSNVDGVLFISTKKDSFIAGADVNMITDCGTVKDATALAKEGQRIMAKIESSTKPIVAAISGTCLGGGFEFALSCHYRIATDTPSTVFGFPEILLGLLPGSGGTQRSIQLAPLTDAIDLMMTGRRINAKKAKKLGLVNQVVSKLGPGVNYDSSKETMAYLRQIGLEKVEELVKNKDKKIPKRKPSWFEYILDGAIKYDYVRNLMLDRIRKQVLKKTNGLYPAPLKIIEVIKETIQKGAGNCYDFEAEKFGELVVTNESKSLISLFNGQTICKKNKFTIDEKLSPEIGILGGGLMGSGIAYVSMNKGMNVTLKDVNTPALHRASKNISKLVNGLVKRRKISKFEGEKFQSRLNLTTNYRDFSKTKFIIEAVFEDLKLKHAVIQDLEKVVGTDTIIATNTSALPISEISKASKRPENIIGMHYFSPVDKMQLVEIISTSKTSDRAKALTNKLALNQGKIVINVRDAPGFFTTRALIPNVIELTNMALEGMSFNRIEKLTKKLGLPIGGLTLIDEVGIDVIHHIVPNVSKNFQLRMSDSQNCINVLRDMEKSNLLGRKSGKGYFVYSKDKSSARQECTETKDIIKKYSHPNPNSLLNLSETDMFNVGMKRIMFRLVNECVACLEENIISSPVEGDIGAVFGIGFPPFHGGPFRYVDVYGAKKLVDEMNQIADKYGSVFLPNQLLVDYANQNKKFYQ